MRERTRGWGSPGARLQEEEGRPGGLRGKEWAGLAGLPLLPLEFFSKKIRENKRKRGVRVGIWAGGQFSRAHKNMRNLNKMVKGILERIKFTQRNKFEFNSNLHEFIT